MGVGSSLVLLILMLPGAFSEPAVADLPEILVPAAPSRTLDVRFAAAPTAESASWQTWAVERAPRSLENRSRLTPKTVDRPAEFWWKSPAEILEGVYGGCGVRECCKFCSKGRACGDSCISAAFTCRVGCGCACQRPLGYGD